MTEADYTCKIVYLQCKLANMAYQQVLRWTIGEYCANLKGKITHLTAILSILNRYDTRDLPSFTTDYNKLKESQVLCLLNYAEQI